MINAIFFKKKKKPKRVPEPTPCQIFINLFPGALDFQDQTSCERWYKSANNDEELFHFPSTVLGYPSCVVRRQLKEAAGMHAELKANNAIQANKILNKTLVRFLWFCMSVE